VLYRIDERQNLCARMFDVVGKQLECVVRSVSVDNRQSQSRRSVWYDANVCQCDSAMCVGCACSSASQVVQEGQFVKQLT
jgi:hypothetical protein